MLRLTNPVRPYSWGSTSAIADLLGIADDGEPKAELWLGAHPDSPSLLPDGGRLDDADRRGRERSGRAVRRGGLRPAAALPPQGALGGAAVVAAGASRTPSRPWPDSTTRRAEEFRRTLRTAGTATRSTSPRWSSRSTPFDALCGLRDPALTLPLLGALDVEHPAWSHLLDLLSAADSSAALRDAVSWLLGDDDAAAVAGAGGRAGRGGERPSGPSSRPPRRWPRPTRTTRGSWSRCCSTGSGWRRARRSSCRRATSTRTCTARPSR